MMLSPIAITSMFIAVPVCAEAAAPHGRPGLPGRQVKVAAIAIGFGGDHDAKLKLALEHLETAGQGGVDAACLPEEFAGSTPEPLNGPTTQAVAAIARKYHMYVIPPICEQADDGRQYNTSVLLDREGNIAGCYRKIFVYWGEKLNVSEDGVKVFDTDFGRIAILTCFDANFGELWQEAANKGAEIVFWPSAYGGGMVLNGYAMCHNYYVVPVGQGNIIDCTGRAVEPVEKPRPDQFIATLDLDRTFIHRDFNVQKVQKLLAEHKDDVTLEGDFQMEGWYLLRSTRAGVLVRDLCRQYGIEPLREYRLRSREQINQARRERRRI